MPGLKLFFVFQNKALEWLSWNTLHLSRIIMSQLRLNLAVGLIRLSLKVSIRAWVQGYLLHRTEIVQGSGLQS